MSSWLGPLLVLVFCLSQAFRDVYFGHLFQGVDFFAIILLAFVLSTAIFAPVALIRARAEFAILRVNWRTVLAMNVTTAIAWNCYFFGLTHLEPSIVNAIHSGMAPLTVALLGAFGVKLAKPQKLGPWEWGSYAGIAATVAALWWVVLSGRSGIPSDNPRTLGIALALLVGGGASITVSLLYAKRLNDRGVGSAAVTTVRYPLIIAVAALVEIARGGGHGSWGGIHGAGDAAFLAAAATALIVLPLYAMQAGTAPLTAQIIRALGPVFVFALEQFDGRLHYSEPVLICILGYSLFVAAGNFAHGWREPRQRTERAVAAKI
jgi:drug/metabolite transporter (DMT)-like permease